MRKMGFWSMNCVADHCGHPLLSRAAVQLGAPNEWMMQGVSLAADGSVIVGEYDGYGSLGRHENALSIGDDQNVWHVACWDVAGRPGFAPTRPAMMSDDQGYFFSDDKHSKPDPREHVEELLDSGSRDVIDSVHSRIGIVHQILESELPREAGRMLTNVEVTRHDLVRWLVRYRQLAASAGRAPLEREPAWLSCVPIASAGDRADRER